MKKGGVCEETEVKSERERREDKVSSTEVKKEGLAACGRVCFVCLCVFMCVCVCVCVGGLWCRASGTPCALPVAGGAVRSCWAIDGFLREKAWCRVIAKEIRENSFTWLHDSQLFALSSSHINWNYTHLYFTAIGQTHAGNHTHTVHMKQDFDRY